MTPKKIVILSNNYQPELTGPASYITTLAEYLVSCGDSVTVLTSPPHYPHWKFYPGYGQSFYKRTEENGVDVVRGPLYVPASPTALKRIAYDLSYTLSSLLKGVTLRQCDVVICVSPPLTIGLTAEILGFLKKCPFILHIMDLIPDAPVALGMLKNQTIISALHRLEKHVYKAAGGIIAITPGFSRNLKKKGIQNLEKIALIPIWVDTDEINPTVDGTEFRRQFKIPLEDFVITYSGNMGNKQGLETLIEAAALMPNGTSGNTRFLMVGEGAQKDYLFNLSKTKNLANTTFLPLMPRDQFPALLAASDVLAITQKKSVTDICLPSKLISNCAAGKPIIAAVDDNSETAHFISEAGCGVVSEPENPAALKNSIVTLHDHPNKAAQYGRNGRKHVEIHYNKNKVLSAYRNFIHEVAQPS